MAHLCPADGAVPPQGWQAEAGQPQPVRAAFQLPCRQVLPHPGPPHAQTGLAALQGSHPARPPDCQPAGPSSALLGGPEVPLRSRSFTWSRPSCVRRESASGRVTRPRLGVQPTALTGRTRVADAEAWSVGPQPPRSQYPPLPKAPIVALDGRLAMSDCPNCSPTMPCAYLSHCRQAVTSLGDHHGPPGLQTPMATDVGRATSSRACSAILGPLQAAQKLFHHRRIDGGPKEGLLLHDLMTMMQRGSRSPFSNYCPIHQSPIAGC